MPLSSSSARGVVKTAARETVAAPGTRLTCRGRGRVLPDHERRFYALSCFRQAGFCAEALGHVSSHRSRGTGYRRRGVGSLVGGIAIPNLRGV
jgi:hypothetical protein